MKLNTNELKGASLPHLISLYNEVQTSLCFVKKELRNKELEYSKEFHEIYMDTDGAQETRKREAKYKLLPLKEEINSLKYQRDMHAVDSDILYFTIITYNPDENMQEPETPKEVEPDAK